MPFIVSPADIISNELAHVMLNSNDEAFVADTGQNREGGANQYSQPFLRLGLSAGLH
jgi:hypothetical protein